VPRPGVPRGRGGRYPGPVRRGLAALAVALVGATLVAGSASGALRLARVTGGLSAPVDLAATPSQAGTLYVVEQAGIVRVVRNGRLQPGAFLDLRDRVSTRELEQGLLGLAFHPRYASNGRLYVNFTNNAGDTRVVEFRANAARTAVNEGTGRVLLAVPQPYSNHNGGDLVFGRDGFLYVPLGDGGDRGDPQNRAQSMRTRLGKLVRINVSSRATRIVALGFRNPWRASVDRGTGRLWIADVGQGTREEVDVWRPGASGLENYGWRRFEGTTVHNSGTRLYARSRYVPPVHQYETHANGGCAITGGFVYRGAIRAARGRYFFGDYCNGRVSSFVLRNGRRADLRTHAGLTVPGNLSSFGEGPTGELFLLSHSGGTVYRLVAR
jgi:glucose/arabinose dehydrogenase